MKEPDVTTYRKLYKVMEERHLKLSVFFYAVKQQTIQFFKLYPTATEKELAYYVKDSVLAPVSGDYVFSELVNPVFTKDGDKRKVSVSVKYLDNKSKMTQISQYELVLHKDDNWKIIG